MSARWDELNKKFNDENSSYKTANQKSNEKVKRFEEHCVNYFGCAKDLINTSIFDIHEYFCSFKLTINFIRAGRTPKRTKKIPKIFPLKFYNNEDDTIVLNEIQYNTFNTVLDKISAIIEES